VAASPNFPLLCLNGQIVDAATHGVSYLSPAFRYAATAFEGIKAYWNADTEELLLFRLEEHLARLVESCRIMYFDPLPAADVFIAGIKALIKKLSPRETCHVRLYCYIDGDGSMWATGPVSWLVTLIRTPRKDAIQTGIHCGISSWRRISDDVMPPRAKVAANYNNGRLASIQGRLDGYDNIILLTQQGHVSETPGSCFLMVSKGRIITPTTTDSILESITRDTVLQLAREELGLRVVERQIDRTETYLADEAFLCGSAQEVTPVLSIDRRQLGDGTPGPVTTRLRDTYFRAVLGQMPGKERWVTPVKH